MRSKRVLYFTISSFALQILTAVFGFLVSRMLLSTYGSSSNGLIALVNQMLSYLRLVEAGLGFASMQALLQPLAEENWGKVNRILSTTAHYYRVTAMAFSGLLAVSVIFMPLLSRNEVDPTTAILILVVTGAGVALEYYVGGKFTALLTACQKGYVLNIAQCVSLTLGTVIGMLLMMGRYDLLIVKAAMSACNILRILLVWLYVRVKHPTVRFNLRAEGRLVSQRWNVLVHQLASLVVMNTDMIVLSIFTSLKVVSVYSVYSMVFRMPLVVLQSVFEGFTSGLGQVLAEKDPERKRTVFNEIELLSIMLVMMTATGVLVTAIPFIRLYTIKVGDINYIHVQMAVLYALVIMLSALRGPYLAVINAIGHFKATQGRAIAEAAINLTISLTLVGSLGVYGVLLATLASYLYRTTDTILYTYKHVLGGSSRRAWIRIAANLLVCGSISAGLMVFSNWIALGWIPFFIYAAFAGLIILPLVIALNWWMDKTTVRNLWTRAAGILGLSHYTRKVRNLHA